MAGEADQLKWLETYASSDFGERFLDNYGYKEWVGRRSVFANDRSRAAFSSAPWWST